MKTLKHLQTRLKEITDKENDLKEQISLLQKSLRLVIEDKNKILLQIENFNNKDVEITEHALLRYLERYKGVNIESLKREIINDNIRQKILLLGNCTFPNGKFKLKVINKKIVTIL